jgi:hypothetical protein
LYALRELKNVPSNSQPAAKDVASLFNASDVKLNIMWRFLQLRGYVDKAQHLTAWGNALVAALEALDSSDEAQEAGLLGVELLRLGLIDGSDLNGISRTPGKFE